MNNPDDNERDIFTCDAHSTAIASQLNNSCYCKTLDRNRVNAMLTTDNVGADLLATHPQLFSNIATFISATELQHISDTIDAIEAVIARPDYQQRVLSQAHFHAQFNGGTAGVFMGYDFHLDQDRPKLIEINTNAGGAFLNALLIGAQTACCPPMQGPFLPEKDQLNHRFVEMFVNEWRLQRGDATLNSIAIVDVHPEQQFLYPEFTIAKRVFESRGLQCVIVAPQELSYTQGRLTYAGQEIDLVYNRLTDFLFTDATSQMLNAAYQDGAVVVTPNPHHYALYADKRHLILLSDEVALRESGANEAEVSVIMASVPVTRQVTADNAEELWRDRRSLFFKPTTGFGGKATYRGDKLTKRVWDEILQGQYVAQLQVAPSERGVLLDGQASSLKMDVRAYTYQGKIQLLAARLYQGQTTNFRTRGGGFAPVFSL